MTDHTFYTDKYLSGKEAVLSAASFAHWERKACNHIRRLTFGNIDETGEIPEAVQMCACEVAELLFTQSERSKGVASEKVGDYSVTYKEQTEADKAKEIHNVISEWLSDTGLMYCGVM